MTSPTTGLGRLHLWMAQLALAAVYLGACYHPRVAVVQQPVGIDPTSQEQSETLWSIAWGLAQDTYDASASCRGSALQSVTTHSNLGFGLLTVVTIGFVSPVTVTWRCAKPETPVVDDSQDAGSEDPL